GQTALWYGLDHSCDRLLHPPDERGSAVTIPGDRTELPDLGIRAAQVLRRRLQQDADAELSQARDDVVRVTREDDEIGPVTRDCLDVRRVAGEACPRRPLRIVRLVIDGDDLLAGTDREQRLSCGRRERD